MNVAVASPAEDPMYQRLYKAWVKDGCPRNFTHQNSRYRAVKKEDDRIVFVNMGPSGLDNEYGQSSLN